MRDLTEASPPRIRMGCGLWRQSPEVFGRVGLQSWIEVDGPPKRDSC